MRCAKLLLVSLTFVVGNQAGAQVKIGVLTDLNSVYEDISGKGSVIAAQMAADDFGPVLAKPVEVFSANHENSPDVATAIARRWYEADGVDMITDGGPSPVALAVENVSRLKHKLVLFSGPASTDITGKNCSPYAANWTYDTYALSHVIGSTIVRDGGKRWFFLGADHAFGHTLETQTSVAVESEGGRVVDSIFAPPNTSDFSSFLLRAKASNADIVALANAGGDAMNSVKQGAEFGLAQGGQKLAALFMFTTDLQALGLEAAQGLRFASAFYWDKDNDSRAFSERFRKKVGHMPTMIQAGVYSATSHYLKAVEALGSKEPLAVMAKMRELPINDFMTHGGILRVDGRVVRDMYLLQAKRPQDSKGPWDYAEIVEVVPGDRAFRALENSACPLTFQ